LEEVKLVSETSPPPPPIHQPRSYGCSKQWATEMWSKVKEINCKFWNHHAVLPIYKHYFSLDRINTTLLDASFLNSNCEEKASTSARAFILWFYEFVPDDGQRTRPKHVAEY
jgi:hypothetical protein